MERRWSIWETISDFNNKKMENTVKERMEIRL